MVELTAIKQSAATYLKNYIRNCITLKYVATANFGVYAKAILDLVAGCNISPSVGQQLAGAMACLVSAPADVVPRISAQPAHISLVDEALKIVLPHSRHYLLESPGTIVSLEAYMLCVEPLFIAAIASPVYVSAVCEQLVALCEIVKTKIERLYSGSADESLIFDTYCCPSNRTLDCQ